MSGRVESPRAREGAAPGSAGHLLRLALDLQVDALLFSVSADVTMGRSSLQSRACPDTAPWERWLTGDLEAVLRLAEGVVEEHLPLPAVLSGAYRRESRVLDDLRARYITILALLSEAAALSGVAVETSSSPALARTLSDLEKHYEERLRELGGRSVVRQHGAQRV